MINVKTQNFLMKTKNTIVSCQIAIINKVVIIPDNSDSILIILSVNYYIFVDNFIL